MQFKFYTQSRKPKLALKDLKGICRIFVACHLGSEKHLGIWSILLRNLALGSWKGTYKYDNWKQTVSRRLGLLTFNIFP